MQCSTTTKISPTMESPVMWCHCSKTKVTAMVMVTLEPGSAWRTMLVQASLCLDQQTYSAGPSATPAAVAPGATCAAAPPTAAPAAVAEGGPGGAWATCYDWFAMKCAHHNLCPVQSRSYSRPGLIQKRNTDIEGHKRRHWRSKLRYLWEISQVSSILINRHYVGMTLISTFWPLIMNSTSTFLCYWSALILKVATFDIDVSQNSGIRYWRSKPLILNGHIVPYIKGRHDFQNYYIKDWVRY